MTNALLLSPLANLQDAQLMPVALQGLHSGAPAGEGGGRQRGGRGAVATQEPGGVLDFAWDSQGELIIQIKLCEGLCLIS